MIKKPGVSDLFGQAGREWLREVELPVEERETVDGCLRQIEFLDAEITEVEKQIARDALGSPQIKRLMTVPGVNVIVAATFLAAVGDVSRFPAHRRRLAIDEGRERDTGTRITKALEGQAAQQGNSPKPCALARRRPRPTERSHTSPPPIKPT